MSSLRLVCSGLGALLLLGACAQRPATPAAVALAEASAQRGAQALARQEFTLAEREFTTALRIHEALGDTPARAIDLLNLARVQAEAGQTTVAMATVQQVLNDRAALPPATLITAHGRAAGLALAQPAATSTASAAPDTPGTVAAKATDNANASTIAPLVDQHLDAALALCANSCPQQAALLVLQGRVALAHQNAPLASQRASQALAASPTAPSEQANALRLQAQAQLMLAQLPASAASASAALALDRQLGLRQRVLMDLQLLVQIHTAQGNQPQAEHYRLMAVRAQAAGRELSGLAP